MVDFTGGTWRSLIDGSEVSAIPDTVVSRPDDDSTGNSENADGVAIATSQEWVSIGAELSSKVGDGGTFPSRARLYDLSADSFLDTIDISSLSAGDTFTFNDVNLEANSEYIISLDNDGNEYTRGILDASFPYTSGDGNLEIIAGSSDGTTKRDDFAFNIVKVGNVGFD